MTASGATTPSTFVLSLARNISSTRAVLANRATETGALDIVFTTSRTISSNCCEQSTISPPRRRKSVKPVCHGSFPSGLQWAGEDIIPDGRAGSPLHAALNFAVDHGAHGVT